MFPTAHLIPVTTGLDSKKSLNSLQVCFVHYVAPMLILSCLHAHIAPMHILMFPLLVLTLPLHPCLFLHMNTALLLLHDACHHTCTIALAFTICLLLHCHTLKLPPHCPHMHTLAYEHLCNFPSICLCLCVLFAPVFASALHLHPHSPLHDICYFKSHFEIQFFGVLFQPLSKF